MPLYNRREPKPRKDLLVEAIGLIILSAAVLSHYITLYYYSGNPFGCKEPKHYQLASRNFINNFVLTFLRKPVCELKPPHLMQASLFPTYVFIGPIALSSATTLVTFITSILFLIAVVAKPTRTSYLAILAYSLLILLIIGVITDAILTILFGLSLTTLNDYLNGSNDPTVTYTIDLARIGALFFTVITKDLVINYLIRLKFIYDILRYLSENSHEIEDIQIAQAQALRTRLPIAAYQESTSDNNMPKRNVSTSGRRDHPSHMQPKTPRLSNVVDLTLDRNEYEINRPHTSQHIDPQNSRDQPDQFFYVHRRTTVRGSSVTSLPMPSPVASMTSTPERVIQRRNAMEEMLQSPHSMGRESLARPSTSHARRPATSTMRSGASAIGSSYTPTMDKDGITSYRIPQPTMNTVRPATSQMKKSVSSPAHSILLAVPVQIEDFPDYSLSRPSTSQAGRTSSSAMRRSVSPSNSVSPTVILAVPVELEDMTNYRYSGSSTQNAATSTASSPIRNVSPTGSIPPTVILTLPMEVDETAGYRHSRPVTLRPDCSALYSPGSSVSSTGSSLSPTLMPPPKEFQETLNVPGPSKVRANRPTSSEKRKSVSPTGFVSLPPVMPPPMEMDEISKYIEPSPLNTGSSTVSSPGRSPSSSCSISPAMNQSETKIYMMDDISMYSLPELNIVDGDLPGIDVDSVENHEHLYDNWPRMSPLVDAPVIPKIIITEVEYIIPPPKEFADK